jgi:hypothetical protein
MQSNRVRPVRRPRREHARQRMVWIAARMYLQHVAPGPVQLGQHDDVIAFRQAIDRVRRKAKHFQPHVRVALESLFQTSAVE